MDLLHSARLTLRDLARHPGFTSAAVATLALAIGANGAMFGVVYAALLKPSAIRQPGNLVTVWERQRASAPVVELSHRNFEDLATHARSFDHVAAFGSSTWPVILDAGGEAARLSSAGVSASFFETLRVQPALGRVFRPDDDRPNAPRVVILSHGTWVRRFGGDPNVVGTTIQLEQPHTIVGVMPRAFDFPRGTDVWLPVVPILAGAGDGRLQSPLESVGVLFLVGRLHEGVTAAMASEELDRLAAQQQRVNGVRRFGDAMVVTPFLDYLMGPVRQALWALFAAVAVLLLIACATVSGLMLTRVSLRRREQAVRMALGATRAQLGQRWILETVILAATGGALGLALMQWIAKGLTTLAPDDVAGLSEVGVNAPVAAFTFGAMLGAAILCGVQPVWYGGSASLIDALADGSHVTPGKRTHRARSILLAVQVGLAVVLLVVAGLVTRSFIKLRTLDLGFVPANVLTMNVEPRDPRPSGNEWMQGLLDRLARLPAVEAAGAVSLRPLALGPIGSDTWVVLDGQPGANEIGRLNPTLNYQVASPGYFNAMRIPLIRGRLFTDRDNGTSPRVALVGESTARHLWRGADPIGKRMLMPSHSADGGQNVWRTVVGVVGDVRYRGLDDVRLDVYDAALQAPSIAADLVIRTSVAPLTTAAAVQTEARRLDPHVILDRVTTMDAIVSRAAAPWRFSVWMFTLFAAMAFLLAAVGLFSLVSLDVTHRRREFAVRLALGARVRDVHGSVLVSALRRALPAVIVGVMIAGASSRTIGHLLFDVTPLDPFTYGAVIALVMAVVAAAAWLPAYRAAHVDPMVLLKRV